MNRVRIRTRAMILFVLVAMLTTLVSAQGPSTALAAGTVLFNNSFNDNTVDGVGTVTLPSSPSGTNLACLTATGNTTVPPVLSCAGNIDAQGSGTLRMTSASGTQVGAVVGKASFPTSTGLDVTFNSYQWGGNGADGLSLVLGATDPTNPAPPVSVGPGGGSLGYSSSSGVLGLANAYLGIGFDVYGNFSSKSFEGSGCTDPADITNAFAGAVVVRGPGNGTVGYCGLTTTYDGTAGSKVNLRASTRAESAVPAEVLINPTSGSLTTASGVTVAADSYKVIFTAASTLFPFPGVKHTLTGPLPAASAGLYPSTTWLNANGVPKQMTFGFTGSTGGLNDAHEFANVKASTFGAVPQLSVATTSYAATTSGPGAPVTYSVAASVLSGTNETSPVSVTLTSPTGVVPLGADGTGWVCQAPLGQKITCTTSGSSFTNGTALPGLTVVAIVTGASVASTLVQSSTTTTVSSADGNPGTAITTTAGTLPATPAGITLTPGSGSVAGGGTVTIGGTNIAAATAIEIATTSELQAGTPVLLLPCPGGVAAPGCFTVSGGTLVISSMPARPSGSKTVSVTVVTSGVASAAAYVYTDKPVTPAAPTATAGITSAVVTWVAPDNSGSTITGYVVTPYLAGVAQTAQTFDASATTRTVTGLTAGGSYTFTVAAINALGTSAASAKSTAVIPYTLPGAPAIAAVSAGDSAATLTWTAPASNGGSAITGYLVTPYIGGVAQPTQTFAGTATTQTATGLTARTAYTFTVAAQNLAGTGPASAPSASVTPNVSPSLAFAAPPSGEVGVTYSRQLAVSDGTAPFVWSVSSGVLPAGLTLNPSTGLLNGTPTAAGTVTFTVQVVDASNQSATKVVTLIVAAAPTLAFAPPAGEVGVAYSQQPTISGGTAPFAWAVSAGSLPSGLTLNSSTGLLSGTPTAAGSFTMTIAATDTFGQVAAGTVTLVVVARPAFTAATPPSGQVGVTYTTSLGVTGGTLPLTWSVPAGSPPPGLTFNTATGVLSGTPTTIGSYPFTVSVTDADGQTATKAVTLVVAAGPLVIVKTANVSSASAGSAVAYTITITNTGTTAWTGVTMTDPLTGVLDDAAYNTDATTTAGTVSYASPTLGWTGNIAANGSVTITYSVTVNNPDTGNKVLANTVTSTTLGTNCPAGSADSRCSTSVTVPGLTIVATADVSTTTPGSIVHFTIVVTNTGQTAYPTATLTDGLAGVFDDDAYNADGTATSGSVTFASPSLTWTGALAVGASATITYSVTVANPDNGNRSMTGTVVSPTAGSPCPSVNPAAQCTVTVTVLVPALSIATSANVSTTTPGSTVAYTMTLSNTGQTVYTGTSVTIGLAGVLDDATYDNNAAASSGSVVFNAGVPSLVWTGDLAIGAAVTVTGSVTVRSPDPGDKTMTTVATTSAPGSTCPVGSPNPACVTTVRVLIPGLTITNSANVATTTPGSVVRYSVSVTNTGQTPYTGATFVDALAGVLDDAGYANDVATTAGAVSVNGSTLTWSGDLLIGATATITYSVTVRSPDPGDLALTSAVTSTTAGNNCPSAGTDPRCASSVTVLIPGLTITSTAHQTTTTPGTVVRYTVTVVNSGQTPYTGASITFDPRAALDDATYDKNATITSGSLVVNTDGTLSWTVDLAPGASATSTLSVTVNNPDLGDKVLRTTVISDVAGSTCPTGTIAAACHTAVTVLVPGLTITKTANTSTVTPGGTVGYTISVVNNGQTTYSPASVTDDLATVLTDATYGGGATATTGTVSYNGSVLLWSGTLAPGGSATITYSVTVRDPDPGDKRMYNTVVSSAAGNNCPSAGTDPRCAAVVNVLVPGLTIVKTANAPTTVPGAVVGYTITVTNSGATPFTAATSTAATFADSLTGVLDDAAYNADAAATTGTVGFAGSTLTWTGDLAVGAVSTITYSVTVHTADGGDNLLTDTVTSTARGDNCTAGSTDTRCTVTVPVARLVLWQRATETTTTPGSVVHLTETYINTGQVPYFAISVASPRADTADDTIPTGDQVASSGTLVRTSAALTWTGDIPVGGTVTITRTLKVLNPDTGNMLITATLNSTAPGNNCLTGSADARCTFLITVLIPELTVTKTANTTVTMPGGTVGYTITVHNTGQTPYTGASVTDSLTGDLDDGGYNADAVSTIGATTYSSAALVWTGDLAVGATATITYSVTVRSPDTGDKTLVNSVSSTTLGSTCPPASGNAACGTTVPVLTPALTIVKTADLANATLGSTVTYTVTVTDSGQTSYASAAFTDSLAGVVDDATYNSASSTSGTVGFAAGVLSWSGALTPGGSATVTYTVKIDNPDTGDHTMTNTAVSTDTGSNCASGSTDTRCTTTVAITNSVSLTFTKTADVTNTVAGGVVHYTVTVTNSSGGAIAGATFTDPLATILDDATYNGDVAASGGTAVYANPNLTWTGSVPALGTVTITYSVTVYNPATGDGVLSGTISSTSLPASDNCLAGSTDPRCTNSIPVAGLLIQQHYAETSITPGSVAHLSATFTNTGQMPYVGITVSSPSADTVDDAIPTGDQSATSGTLVLSATAITWSGNIPVGGVVTITGTLTVMNPDTGNRIITGTLVSSAVGNNCPAAGTDTRCTALLPVLLPGLTITKSANASTVLPGATVGYTITAHNSGQTPYVGTGVADSLVGVLGDAGYNADAVASSGALAYASPILTWTGDLAVGATATITYSVTVRSPDTGGKTMVNVVTSTAVGSTCPVGNGSAACQAAVNVLTPGLTISSATDVATTVPGGAVTSTIILTDTGQTSYTPATLTVALGGVLDDATYGGGVSATTGTVGISGQTLTWTGALDPGGTATITYTVTVDNPDGGDFRLTQAVVSTDPGSTCLVGATNPLCGTSVPVASLRIVNTADVSTTKPTSVVRYTGTFTNTGQVPYVGISVSDSFVGVLDDAAYNGDATATVGSLILVAGSGKIVWTGDLAVGATVTITGSATVNNPDLGDKTLRTVITTAAVASNCPTAGTDPLCATAVTVLTPALTIGKTVDTTTATPGSLVGYTITVTDSGQTPYTAAKVSDSLGGLLNDATYTGDVTATGGSVTVTRRSMNWTGDLAVGQWVIITYSVRVNSPDLGDESMANGVVSTELGSTCPTAGAGPACTTTVDVLVPALDIAVTADSTTTTPGTAVGYTVTVRNTGETPYVGANVVTTLAGVLDDATYAGGATATAGTVTFTTPTLTWTGDLAVGATAIITYQVTVSDPDAGNRSLDTSVTSSAPGSTCGSAAQCANTVTVLIPGLAVSTTADVATTTPGSRVVFTVTASNTGQTPYVGTIVSTDLGAILDDATFDGMVTASAGVATYTAPNLSWTGSLPVGATVTVTYAVLVRNPDTGDRTLSTTVTDTAPGSTCRGAGAGPACTATVTVLIPDLAISKTASVPTTTPGSVVGYTIVATNTGQTAYTGVVITDSLNGVLPDADYNGDAAAARGTLGYANSTLTWTGDLPIGASVTIAYSITVHNPDTGDKQLINTVVSTAPGSTCQPGTPACSTEVQVLVPALVITKTADTATTVAGSAVHYSVTLTNTGQTAYVPAQFTDPLAGVLDDASYAGDAAATTGSLAYANGTLVWTGALGLGASATITYSVTTLYPATGDHTLTNTVSSSSPGANCGTGTDPRCATTVTVLVPALTITKTADTGQIVAGGTVRYTLSATNTGQAEYPAANLTDSLAGVLDDAVYNGDATATTGTLGYTGGTLSWSGDLVTGATVTIGYSVTANVVDTGDAVLANRVVSTSVGSTCASGGTDPRCATSIPVLARTVTLTSVTRSFTLTGLPNTTVTSDGTVTMTVTSNSPGGYVVTVQAASARLTGAAPGNTDTIPIGQLGVRETGTSTFQPLSATTPLVVHRQNAASAPGGDAVSNDYRVQIPFVSSDTYSITLDYIVSTQ